MQCNKCKRTLTDYVENLDDIRQRRSKCYTPQLISLFDSYNEPYSFCYTCNQGTKTTEQIFSERETFLKTKINITVSESGERVIYAIPESWTTHNACNKDGSNCGSK